MTTVVSRKIFVTIPYIWPTGSFEDTSGPEFKGFKVKVLVLAV
jgi:hypothetical protein